MVNRGIMSSHEEFAHLKIRFQDILEATNNFSKENLIGEGGFGKVYKGNLLVSGKPTVIAAKKLHFEYGQGDSEFWDFISMFASFKLKHENLVSFIGFCHENEHRIIINKYEVNGSLDKCLSNPTLTWMQRLRICVDVAGALKYIYNDDELESSVIHRNIKSSKILLDENWKPKLSGFEFSKKNPKVRQRRLVLADIVGTIGYVDPEYENTGFVSHKSDVYSFGVVLFEVLCGRRVFIPDEAELDSLHSSYHHDTKEENLDVIPKQDEIPDQIKRSSSQPSFSEYREPTSFSGREPTSFSGREPTSFSGREPTSFSGREPTSFSGISFSGREPTSDDENNKRAVSFIKGFRATEPEPSSIDDIEHVVRE